MLKKLATRRHAYLVLISTVFFVIIVIFPTILCTGCSRKRPETLYTLLVNVEPAEAGIVFIEPSGPSYKKGTTVFLFALGKADNYAFYQWTGDLAADDDNPAKVVMNANKNVTAHFKELDYNLTVEMEGKGRIIRKIVTGEGDAGPVQIQLTAHPDPGWAFLKWTGDLTGSDNPARLILDGDKTITAYFTEVPGGRMITGRVTYGRSGSPAKLATVTLVKDGIGLYNTVADPEGWYSLPVKAGEEVELIAAKEGFAGSRFQGVVVPAGESFRADMIMQNPEVPGGSVTPPSLTVAGVNSGQTISGTKRISVQLKGEHEPRVLYIDIGSESNRHPYGFASNPFSIPLNTRGYPDGPSFIYIAAYDQNQNLVTTRIPVIIKNGSPAGVHLVMRKPLQVVAYTQGDDMQIESLARPCSFPGLYLHQRDFPQVQRDFSSMAAEERSACFVQLSWEKEFDSDSGFGGYNVYRSSSANGPWLRLGNADEDREAGRYYFFDMSSDVTPGVRSYYKVVPYGPGGVEGSGKTGSVIPLGRFEVRLKTPAHEATGVPLNPTLKWEHNGLEADLYDYALELVSLSEESDPPRWAYSELSTNRKDKTSVVYDSSWEDYFALQNNWVYQWDVIYARAFKLYDYATDGKQVIAVYSAAFSLGRKSQAYGSYNGAFVFTTGDAK